MLARKRPRIALDRCFAAPDLTCEPERLLLRLANSLTNDMGEEKKLWDLRSRARVALMEGMTPGAGKVADDDWALEYI